MYPKNLTEIEAFWTTVNKDRPISTYRPDLGKCWLWIGSIDDEGYGWFNYHSKQVRAHRYSYQLANGPFQKGLIADHLCRIRNCVNQNHLEQVTIKENLLRGKQFARENPATHCRNGHLYEHLKYGESPKRHCYVCARLNERERHRRRCKAEIRGRYKKRIDCKDYENRPIMLRNANGTERS